MENWRPRRRAQKSAPRSATRGVPRDDKYTYPNSGGVLQNLLDIRDAHALDEATDAFVSVEWAALLQDEPPTTFDRAYLQHIHRRLFGEVFAWAGEIRDVEVQAGGTSLVYSPARLVGSELDEVFRELAAENYLCGRDALEFVRGLSRTWARLTRIHPFRDGNTRSQTFFISRLAEGAGHPINWERVEVAALREQRLAAAAGSPEALGFYLEDRLVDPPKFDW
jgi:cell filamentation protein